MKPLLILLGVFLSTILDGTESFQYVPSKISLEPSSTCATRRAFLASNTAAIIATLSWPQPGLSADVKVTPIAHTFITSSGATKPIRENDATRFFTNARVVYLFG